MGHRTARRPLTAVATGGGHESAAHEQQSKKATRRWLLRLGMLVREQHCRTPWCHGACLTFDGYPLCDAPTIVSITPSSFESGPRFVRTMCGSKNIRHSDAGRPVLATGCEDRAEHAASGTRGLSAESDALCAASDGGRGHRRICRLARR